MKFRIAMLATAMMLSTGAMAQNHPGGMTGPGQNMPDSRDPRAMDQHMNHGAPSYHGGRECKVYRKHGHSYRKCWTRH